MLLYNFRLSCCSSLPVCSATTLASLRQVLVDLINSDCVHQNTVLYWFSVRPRSGFLKTCPCPRVFLDTRILVATSSHTAVIHPPPPSGFDKQLTGVLSFQQANSFRDPRIEARDSACSKKTFSIAVMASTATTFRDTPFEVQSPDVNYTEDEIVSKYTYQVRRTRIYIYIYHMNGSRRWICGQVVNPVQSVG